MKRFRHSCYFVVQDPLTWDAARRRCTDRGAYLTVLNDNRGILVASVVSQAP
ncbi:hypothetical protein DPMN_149123 [Dreissena polymorpha]|uniref:C-type lectin n=1 Tax=Dreissena polymorpha TaxID=45954 RepID=A0A9D4FD65_DREPO|nr:hypothetical protein DPMN_149123 [Dreissena polymorpha]